MSIVLIIVGMVILIVYPALMAIRKGTQQALTDSTLATLLRASTAFVHAYGCLPCPTPAGTMGSGFGRVRGDTGTAMCGTCSIAEGIVPFASLGLPQSVAKDGWSRWITMRIDPALAINFGVVPPTAPCTASDPLPCTLGASQKGLCTASLATTNRIQITIPGSAITQQAALLFVSHGANGYGSYRAGTTYIGQTNAHPPYKGPATACSAAGGFEKCNVDSTLSFTDAQRTDDESAPFDDVLVYMDRNVLVASLGSGVCETTW
jgi:type II secretory pathway pseudopilin PulG